MRTAPANVRLAESKEALRTPSQLADHAALITQRLHWLQGTPCWETSQRPCEDGWASTAGNALLPDRPTRPESDDPKDYKTGFRYGRADALERGFKL